MGGLFSSPTPKMAQQPPNLKGVKVQQSAYGLCVPIVYGTNRLAGDVIWMGKTQAIAHSSSQQTGGKGGGQQQTTQTSYDYRVALCIGLCEGPIVGIGAHWRNKKKMATTAANPWTIHLGALGQSPEAWLVTKHPDAALNYPGQVYVFKDSLELGSSPNLPNLSFEIQGFNIYGSGIVDALPSDIIPDFLSNAYYGVGFPSGLIGSLTQLRNYCLSAGIFISPILSEQKSAADGLNEILTVCNCRAVYSGGVLNFVPMGDEALSGNGATFTPNLTPVAAITDDDLAPGPPISVTRKDQADAYNDVRVEYVDRAHDYNTAIAEARDDGAVAFYGLRAQSPIQAHAITTASVAQFLAQLTVQQNASLLNTYTFTLSPKWIILDPLDIITLTDTRIGLSAAPVRLLTCDEQPDGTFQCTAEDLCPGAYTVQGYGTEPQGGLIPNEDADPGNCNAPVIWESTPAFTGGKKELCIATSGKALAGTVSLPSGVVTFSGSDVFTASQLMGRTLQDSAGIQWPIIGNAASSGGATVLTLLPGAALPAAGAASILPDTWGGCNIWASRDGATYKMIGTLNGPCRHGVLSSGLASSSNVYPVPDTVNTLSVNLAASQGTISSGVQADADLLGTLCWVDGEYLSYETAALVSGYQFNLSYLQRGVYDSSAGSHSPGASFVVLDDAVGRLEWKLEKGKTIYVKLQSFNSWGNALQDISTLTAYTWVVQGLTLGNPTLTLEEIKLRRNLYLASFTDYRSLRHLKIWKRDYSATPGDPDSAPTDWSLYKTVDLATPQADGSLACTRDHVRFAVVHKQQQRECVCIQLTDAHHQKSSYVVDTGGAVGGSDDTAPAIPTIGTVTSAIKDIKATPRRECDLTIPLTFSGCTKVEVEVSDPDGVISRHKVTVGLTSCTFYWKHKFEVGDTLYYRVRGQNGTAFSAWSTLDASWPSGAPSVIGGGGAVPALPTLVLTLVAKNDSAPDQYQLTTYSGGTPAVFPDAFKIRVCKSAHGVMTPDLSRMQAPIDILDYSADPPVCSKYTWGIDLHHSLCASASDHPECNCQVVTRYGKSAWANTGSSPVVATLTASCAGMVATASAAASGGSGSYSTYRYNWGDGSADTVVSVATAQTHTYATSGAKTITLTVTDSLSAFGVDSKTVTPLSLQTCPGWPSVAVSSAWNTPNNATGAFDPDNEILSSRNIPSKTNSGTLALSNPLATPRNPIPDAATIVGVELHIYCFAAATPYITMASLQLLKNGIAVGTDLSVGAPWPSADSELVFGDLASNTWGVALTGADVKASGFGCILSAYSSRNALPLYAYVDAIEFVVSWYG